MANTTKIEIHTRLDDGIYASHGGGEVRVVRSWNAGPRNLLKAINSMIEERTNNVRCYGNIGSGRTWLTIGGVEVDNVTLESTAEAPTPDDIRDARRSYIAVKTATQKAAELLEYVTSGAYAANCKSWREAQDAADRAAGWIE